MKEKQIKILEKFLPSECIFQREENLSRYSTMRLQSFGSTLRVSSIDSLKEILTILHNESIAFRTIGLGSNQVFPDNSPQLFLKLDWDWKLSEDQQIRGLKEGRWNFVSTTPLLQLTKLAINHSLKGFEVFTGVPASLGGAIFMNAGTNLGEIGSLVESVTLMDEKGELKEILVNSQNYSEHFAYRKNYFCKKNEIITHVQLKYLDISEEIPSIIKNYQLKRSETQPLQQKTCGCVFKNPHPSTPAGKLIEEAKLKNMMLGGVRVSPVHANFMENVQGGTYQDFLRLVDLVKERIFKDFGIELELEVQI